MEGKERHVLFLKEKMTLLLYERKINYLYVASTFPLAYIEIRLISRRRLIIRISTYASGNVLATYT